MAYQNRVYPVMAPAFVIVPLLNHFFLREPLSYGIGILLIIGGIIPTFSGK